MRWLGNLTPFFLLNICHAPKNCFKIRLSSWTWNWISIWGGHKVEYLSSMSKTYDMLNTWFVFLHLFYISLLGSLTCKNLTNLEKKRRSKAQGVFSLGSFWLESSQLGSSHQSFLEDISTSCLFINNIFILHVYKYIIYIILSCNNCVLINNISRKTFHKPLVLYPSVFLEHCGKRLVSKKTHLFEQAPRGHSSRDVVLKVPSEQVILMTIILDYTPED